MERYRKYQCATSLVGLKRVKAHFTASQSLVPLLWKRDKGQWQSQRRIIRYKNMSNTGNIQLTSEWAMTTCTASPRRGSI